MFDSKQKGKIKNDKIMRWRLELSTYSFDITYRCGRENIPADTLSRISMSFSTGKPDTLFKLHQSLCHPGITRMAHFVKVRNLPFSLDEIRKVTNTCEICAECKPQYYHPESTHLIKAAQPFERLSMDFKGPIPSNNENKFILTILDEFPRFPFAFPCKDVSSKTIMSCLPLFPILYIWNASLCSLRSRKWVHEHRAEGIPS